MNLDDSKDLLKTESKTKFWVFLFLELFVFGIMFIIYFVNRYQNPSAFKLLANQLSTNYGFMNIVLLLISSLTIVMSFVAVKNKNRFLSLMFLSSSLSVVFLFFVSKLVEFYVLINKGFYPNSDIVINKANEVSMFIWIFYVMSFYHLLHIVFGIVLMFIALNLLIKERNNLDDFTTYQNTNIFWQLSCVIGLIIFPLFYLIN